MLAGLPDHSPDILPAQMTRPCSASIRCSSLAFQMPRLAAANRRFHFTDRVPSVGSRRVAARRSRRPRHGCDARGRTASWWPPRRGRGLLDRDQVHAAEVELAGAEVPQHMRGEPVRASPVDAWRRPRQAPPAAHRHPTRARRRPAFLRSDGNSGAPGRRVVVVEMAPHVSDEPAQRPPSTVDQRNHPFARARTARALAMADVELTEAAQIPLDVVQVELAGLVDPQPDLRHQPGRGIVAGGRRELPARRQLLAPPREQLPDLPAPTAGSATGPRSDRGDGSSHRSGTRPPGRSAGGSRSCAATPGTRSTS